CSGTCSGARRAASASPESIPMTRDALWPRDRGFHLAVEVPRSERKGHGDRGAHRLGRHRIRHLGVRFGRRERGGPARGPRVSDLSERLPVRDAIPPEGERENRDQRLLPLDFRESRGDEGAGIHRPRDGSRGRGLIHYRPDAAAAFVVLRRATRSDCIRERRRSAVSTSTTFEMTPSASRSSMYPIGHTETVRVTTYAAMRNAVIPSHTQSRSRCAYGMRKAAASWRPENTPKNAAGNASPR